MSDLGIIIWIVVIGAAFAFAWKQGYVKQLADYSAETRDELKKCSWPTVDELKGSTVAVVATLLVLGAFTVGADFIISQLVRILLSIG